MAAQLNSSLMTISVISLLVPAAFVCLVFPTTAHSNRFLHLARIPGRSTPQRRRSTPSSAQSRERHYSYVDVCSHVINPECTSSDDLNSYFAYLWFQFYSHNHLFMDTLPAAQRKHGKPLPGDNGPVLPVADPEFHHEAPRLNVPTATAVLVASTALAYITAENLVASLNGMVEHTTVSKEWLTLIVIPIISNAAEHATAVVVARKGKFDLAMSVAVGSCIQIALFVIPLLIMVAWGMGKPLTLLFDPIETMVSILLPHKDVHTDECISACSYQSSS